MRHQTQLTSIFVPAHPVAIGSSVEACHHLFNHLHLWVHKQLVLVVQLALSLYVNYGRSPASHRASRSWRSNRTDSVLENDAAVGFPVSVSEWKPSKNACTASSHLSACLGFVSRTGIVAQAGVWLRSSAFVGFGLLEIDCSIDIGCWRDRWQEHPTAGSRAQLADQTRSGSGFCQRSFCKRLHEGWRRRIWHLDGDCAPFQ